jgi:hypothetical protein
MEKPKHPPLDAVGLFVFYKVLLNISPSNWVMWAMAERGVEQPDAKKIARVATIYLLFTTAVLVFFWRAQPAGGTAKVVVGALACYRLIEIFTFGLGVALQLKASRLGDSWFALALYAFSIVIVFAVLDHSFASSGYRLANGPGPSHPFDYLYIAWTQMVTLGNEYELTTKPAQALAMAAGVSGLSVFGVLVASVLSSGVARLGTSGGAAASVVSVQRRKPDGLVLKDYLCCEAEGDDSEAVRAALEAILADPDAHRVRVVQQK